MCPCKILHAHDFPGRFNLEYFAHKLLLTSQVYSSATSNDIEIAQSTL